MIPESLFYNLYHAIKRYTNACHYTYSNYYYNNDFFDTSRNWVLVKKNELWDNKSPELFIREYIKYIPAKERYLNEISCTISS